MNVMASFARYILAVLLSATISAAPITVVFAQDNQPNRQTSGNDSEQGNESGSQEAAVAQVGAGTTDGSTTGYSGPESNVQASPGENSLPPLPSADLCQSYQDTPAYEACLWVVLRQSPEGTPQ